jgi:hypothetical protein
MGEQRAVYRFLAGVAVGLSLAGGLSLAPAAEAQDKAPSPEAPGSRIHGFFDLSLKNDYITPRGLLVTTPGQTVQVLAGLVLSLYNDPSGPINSASLVVGIWNDIWTDQGDRTVGAWNEFDWFAGVNFTVLQTWKLGVQYQEFLSPPGHFRAESNIEFTLAYDDSKSGLPIAFNPYIRPFWAVSGDSTVVVGKRGGTFDVEIGMVPTLDLNKVGIPIVLSAPTWVTVGPETYWNGGSGVLKCTTCSSSNVGVFSTGLQAKFPLKFIPAGFGNWYARAGAQYYHLLNDNLLYAQTFTRGLTGPVGSPASAARRDVGVLFGAVGFEF